MLKPVCVPGTWGSIFEGYRGCAAYEKQHTHTSAQEESFCKVWGHFIYFLKDNITKCFYKMENWFSNSGFLAMSLKFWT